ncbi:folate-binding protein YgfZ, partial [Burkholderia multivorans]
KGCYPGQEVVARSQYRGTIKRRTALAHVAADTDAVHAGVELFHSDDPGQPCGMIVNAAAAPRRRATRSSKSSSPLAFDALPYAWPTDA